MPKKIDGELKARAVRLVNDHQGEYASLTASAAAAKHLCREAPPSSEALRRLSAKPDPRGDARLLLYFAAVLASVESRQSPSN